MATVTPRDFYPFLDEPTLKGIIDDPHASPIIIETACRVLSLPHTPVLCLFEKVALKELVSRSETLARQVDKLAQTLLSDRTASLIKETLDARAPVDISTDYSTFLRRISDGIDPDRDALLTVKQIGLLNPASTSGYLRSCAELLRDGYPESYASFRAMQNQSTSLREYLMLPLNFVYPSVKADTAERASGGLSPLEGLLARFNCPYLDAQRVRSLRDNPHDSALLMETALRMEGKRCSIFFDLFDLPRRQLIAAADEAVGLRLHQLALNPMAQLTIREIVKTCRDKEPLTIRITDTYASFTRRIREATPDEDALFVMNALLSLNREAKDNLRTVLKARGGGIASPEVQFEILRASSELLKRPVWLSPRRDI